MDFTFNFNPFGFEEMEPVIFEVYIGNQLVEQRQMSGPPQMLQAQFMQMVQQAASQKQPMKIRMVKQDIIFDKFENCPKTLNNYIEFKNWKDKEDD